MANNATSMLSSKMINRISSVVLRARHRMVGALSGIHTSPHRGSSVEFLEHKRYTPGDDIRNVDWKLLARSDRMYVKEYEEETNLRAIIAIDTSASMAYGPEGRDKLHCTRLTACALAYLLLSQSDATGVLSHQHSGRVYVPPRSNWAHYRAIAEAVDGLQAEGQNAWLDHLINLAGTSTASQPSTGAFPKRGMFILFSDLLSDRDEMIRALQLLRDKHHDVMLFHVLHPWELNFPFDAPRVFRSPEDPENNILVDPASVRETYLERIRELQSFYRDESNRLEIDYHLLASDSALEDALITYLHKRAERQKK